MDINASLASRLYASIRTAVPPGEAAPLRPAQEGGFGKAAAGFVDALRQGERAAQQGMVGKADAHSVVTALAASELAVQTAVTVRDKVVEAYQEILRMPV